jgi:hypothetical protein
MQTYRDHIGASVPFPTLEDVDAVLEAVAILDKCKVQRGDPWYTGNSAYSKRDVYTLEMARWTTPPYLAPEHGDHVHTSISARQRGVVIKKAYGRARQWLQVADISPPDPSKYEYEQRNPHNPSRPSWRTVEDFL